MQSPVVSLFFLSYRYFMASAGIFSDFSKEEERVDANGNELPEERCCVARRLFNEIQASGACGGHGTTSEQQLDCRIAEALCQECSGGPELDDTLFGSNGSATSNASAVTEGTTLDRLDPHALQMRCAIASPAEPRSCSGQVGGLGLGLLFLAGLAVVSLSVTSAAAFDWQLRPKLSACLVGRLLGPSPASPKAPRPPPLLGASALPPAPPSSEPPWVPSGFGKVVHSPLGVSSPNGAAEGPADLLRFAGAGGAADLQPPEVSPSPSHGASASPPPPVLPPPPPPAASAAVATVAATAAALDASWGAAPASPSAGRWPFRLAVIWAQRRVFVLVACCAVVLRLGYLVVAAALSFHMALEGALVESVACIAPLSWCVWASRPPRRCDEGIPYSTAYSRICRRLPRFIAYAVLTVAHELYGTTASAIAVASASCDVLAWRVALPYCLGVVVAVARIYSALLALRLQDDFMGACCRVLPAVEAAEVTAKTSREPALGDTWGLDDVALDMETLYIQESSEAASGPCTPTRRASRDPARTPDGLLAVAAPRAVPRSAGAGMYQASGGKAAVAGKEHAWRPQSCAAMQDTSSRSRGRCRSSCCGFGLCRRRGGKARDRRLFLRVGMVAVIVSSTSSAVVARLLSKGEEPGVSKPSSCSAPQNGTATCTAFDLVGTNLWDPALRASRMEVADTLGDCCQGCDELADCQAWMFESVARRCLWIRFLDEPCREDPGHLSCRCVTHYGTTFGFKPVSGLIWVQRPS